MEASLCIKTLGDCSYKAIAKHFSKFIKREAEVSRNQDPEHLHQMRVELRRLRTALQVFSPVVKLPHAASDKQLQKFARCLGRVRDLDVLIEELSSTYLPLLPESERIYLSTMSHKLTRQRAKAFSEVEEMLASAEYLACKKSFQTWLELPKYRAIAPIPLPYAFPTLFLPMLSQLMLHPGWFVGVNLANISQDFLEVDCEYLSEHQQDLHNLRKQIKRARYQAEIFLEFYGEEFANCVNDFRKAQSLLGYMQDRFVLNSTLLRFLKTEVQQVLPALLEIIAQHQIEDWQSWHLMQQNYLNPDFRLTLFQTVLAPTMRDISEQDVSGQDLSGREFHAPSLQADPVPA